MHIISIAVGLVSTAFARKPVNGMQPSSVTCCLRFQRILVYAVFVHLLSAYLWLYFFVQLAFFCRYMYKGLYTSKYDLTNQLFG